MAQVSKPPERRQPARKPPAARGNPAANDAAFGPQRSRGIVYLRKLERNFRQTAIAAFPHSALQRFRANWIPARFKEIHRSGYLQVRSDFGEAKDAVVSWYRSRSRAWIERLAKHRGLFSGFPIATQNGASMMEYGLLASLIALAITVAATLLAGQAAPPG